MISFSCVAFYDNKQNKMFRKLAMKSFKTIEGGTFLLNSRAYMYWSSLLDKQVYGTEIHVHEETYFHSFYNMQKIR